MMMTNYEGRLTRIGVFYDGNYFSHVSNYYLYHHERKARISIQGMHQFLINEISTSEDALSKHCRIIDAHYFRGRISASDAKSRDVLYKERVFEEVLMREGVVTHYLPLSGGGEKGIDVWLALEAFELAIYKRFDVVVLIAGDGDYLPLIRKLNTLGTRVMVLGWDFTYVDQQGNEKTTRTAQVLLDEATYPVLMSSIIDDRARRSEPAVDSLFVKGRSGGPRRQQASGPAAAAVMEKGDEDAQTSAFMSGRIQNLKEGYGFIAPDDGGDNLFFHYSDVENCDFNELLIGDEVVYKTGHSQKGACARHVNRKGLSAILPESGMDE